MKQLTFNLPSELAEKFELATKLTGDNPDVLAEQFVRGYLARALQSAADSFRDPASAPAHQPGAVPPHQPGAVPPPPVGAAPTGPQVPPPGAVPPPPPAPRSPFSRIVSPPPVPPRQGVPEQDRQPRPDYWQEWGKAITRIPRWARNPQQYNHKILRAFFELQQEIGKVTLDALRSRCSDPLGHPNTYVPHFDNNFTQMKFDNGNSHGKVFEEENGYITIWDRISDTIATYRDYFL